MRKMNTNDLGDTTTSLSSRAAGATQPFTSSRSLDLANATGAGCLISETNIPLRYGLHYSSGDAVALVPVNVPVYYTATKRTLDIAVASLLLLLTLPVGLLIAFLIWLEDGGSVFYTQQRVGKDGREFAFYKFRSMVPNADALKAKLMTQNDANGPVFKMRHDPRVTRIGRILRKTSLDEFPQFWNVLRGDMSLVGPRPHLPSEVARYEAYQQLRLSIQPGLICLREVTGRSNLTFERWIETDLLYVQNRSLAMDFQILCRAIPAVVNGDGAY